MWGLCHILGDESMMKFPLLSLTVLNNDNSAVMACLPITHIFAPKIIPQDAPDFSSDSFSILKTQLRYTRWWVERTLALASYVHKRFVPETLARTLKNVFVVLSQRLFESDLYHEDLQEHLNIFCYFVSEID